MFVIAHCHAPWLYTIIQVLPYRAWDQGAALFLFHEAVVSGITCSFCCLVGNKVFVYPNILYGWLFSWFEHFIDWPLLRLMVARISRPHTLFASTAGSGTHLATDPGIKMFVINNFEDSD